jgi:hypothetical protein
MADDNTEVLNAIAKLAKTVEEYHGDFREFRGEIHTKVQSLEDDAKNTRLWQKIQAVCVLPVVGGLHQLAQFFHWIK